MGLLYALEGTDHSFKETQSLLTTFNLANKGYSTKRISFPDYKSSGSYFVRKFLNGEFGELKDIDPRAASLFYSMDRYNSFKTEWGEFYNADDNVIIADRYVGSNIIHQSTRYDSEDDINDYIGWLYDLEFKSLGLPSPNKTLFLNMDPNIIISNNIETKLKGGLSKDIIEADDDGLTKAYTKTLKMVNFLGWTVINCFDPKTKKILEREVIQENILKVILDDIKLHQ